MIEMYAIAALALIIAGAGAGTLVLFAVGIHREDKNRSLGKADPGRIPLGLRTVVCAYAHPALPELRVHNRRDLPPTGSAVAR